MSKFECGICFEFLSKNSRLILSGSRTVTTATNSENIRVYEGAKSSKIDCKEEEKGGGGGEVGRALEITSEVSSNPITVL